jgi:hypothetical protein
MQLSSSVRLEINLENEQMMPTHQKVQLRSSFDFIINFKKETGDASRPRAAAKIEPMLKCLKMDTHRMVQLRSSFDFIIHF